MNEATIKLTEEGISNINEFLKSFGEINIDNISALVFPVNAKLYDNVSVPSGHSHLNAASLKENEELFNQFIPEIRSYFLENNFNINVARDKKKTVKYEVLQNADIILPIITFIGSTAFSIGINVLSNYIYAKYSGNRSNSTIEADVVELESENMTYKRYKISGSASEVVQALKYLSKNTNEVKPNNGDVTKE